LKAHSQVLLANEKFSLNTLRTARFEALAAARVLRAAAAAADSDAQAWVLVVQKRDAKLYKDLLKVHGCPAPVHRIMMSGAAAS
jgi:hypothetical protein